MKSISASLLTLILLFSAVPAQDRTSLFNPGKIIENVKRLSADDFEGRGPGTEGGRRAAQYIADQLKASGAKAANKGSYFQNVQLVGVKADPNTVLKAGSNTFRFGEDFVVTTGAQRSDVSVNADLVFAGYGIDAPEYNWNDYKGNAADYRGKILVILVNDPQATTADPALFGGKALTYYGRWTYKYEEAARHGAAGVILIHTEESAGYGWNVVRTSNGSWRYELARTAGDRSPFLQFKSWMTNSAAEKLISAAGFDLNELRAKANERSFRPINLGTRLRLDLKSELKRLRSPNVVATVSGSDPKLRNEFVVFSAHWDHLGVGEPDSRGDRIYNGAYDNASGVAAVLAIADVLANTPVAKRPKRSFLFLFPTAEEQGLLGAEYYSHHPLVPLSKTIANVNLDGVNFFGKISSFMALGGDRSSMMTSIRRAAEERKLKLTQDARPEQGFFFRSDHFPFAKAGVPAISLQHGDTFITPLTGEAAEFFRDYTAKFYHQPSDEYKNWWDSGAMVQEAEFALSIGVEIANAPSQPRYNERDEFAAAEKKRLRH